MPRTGTVRSGAVATRGDRTREQLLDVAEQLFGRSGISNVSLRQIRLAAGQGNAAAVQYHFGDRDGIVQAIAERHGPRVLAIQAELIDRIDVGAGSPVGPLIDAFVRPSAMYIAIGPSERAWIKMLAELLADPQISLESLTAGSSDQAVELARRILDHLLVTVPAELAAERMLAVSQFTVHLCADRARVCDDPTSTRRLSSDEAFAQNLVDMAGGALTAPVTHPVEAPT